MLWLLSLSIIVLFNSALAAVKKQRCVLFSVS